MLTPSQWVILSIAIASLIVPFVIRLDEGSKPEPFITIDSSSPGSRSIRDILGALLLLLIMSGGVYAAFASKDPSRFRFAIFSPLLMALCLCVLLPQESSTRF